MRVFEVIEDRGSDAHRIDKGIDTQSLERGITGPEYCGVGNELLNLDLMLECAHERMGKVFTRIARDAVGARDRADFDRAVGRKRGDKASVRKDRRRNAFRRS